MIAFGMTGAEQQDCLSAGYGVAFMPKGQIIFSVDRMDLLLQVPMLDQSPQMELGQILQPLGFWCDPGKQELYDPNLCALITSMVWQVISKTYYQAFHMEREVEAIRVYWPKFRHGIPRAVASPEFDRKNLTELLVQERARLNLTAAQDRQFAQAMWRAQAEVEEATDPEGTTLEELVEGTTLFLWKTMFPKEHFPGADMIMRVETNSVVALLREFRVHLGKGRSLVPREIQPTMDEIQQLMLCERSSFEQCQDWIVQARNYSIQAREATDTAIDRYFKGLRNELIAKVTKLDQQLVKLFIGNWYDRLGAKLADA